MKLNWSALTAVDIDEITKKVDLATLEGLLQNLVYARVDREDIQRMGDRDFLKLFHLS